MGQNYLFDSPKVLTNKTIIRSTSSSNEEIIQNILKLYCPNGIDYDPTYSKGNFYKNIDKPKFKSDLKPVIKLDFKANSACLPIKDNVFNSIMFDPPFVGGTNPLHNKDGSSKIKKRFGFFVTIEELWDFYYRSLNEFYRVLKQDGILIFKCQDTILSSKQYLSHVYIIYHAFKIGFYPLDLFVLLKENIMIGHTNKYGQFHARKAHSYFLVFRKQQSKVIYDRS